MSLADTTGLSFEAIRIVGATSESLPSKPSLLSFIPWEICRSYQISKIDEEAHEGYGETDWTTEFGRRGVVYVSPSLGWHGQTSQPVLRPEM